MSYMQAKAVLAKLIWTFDMELTNRDDIDWERDCKLYALWVRPSVIVRFNRLARESSADELEAVSHGLRPRSLDDNS